MMNMVSNPKPRAWSQELYERAVEFHGHGGPFMVIGLRMGLYSLERLDAKGWFDMRCRAMVRWRPPDSCVIDGLQVSTGCTTGKHNMEVEEGEGVAAEFRKGEESLVLRLREEVLLRVRETLSEEDGGGVEELMRWLKEAPVDQLFEAVGS